MGTLYKIIYIIKFFFAIAMIFLWFFGTWNLISFLILSKECIPAKVNFKFTGSIYAGTGGDIYYKYGYTNNKEVRLDDKEWILKNEILDVWLIEKPSHYNAYLRKPGESSQEFRLNKVGRFFKRLSIWIGVYLTLHVITLIIKKYVHIKELPPRPKQNFYDY